MKTSENLAEARAFTSELVSSEGKNPKRGPFLAQIELEKRVQEKIGAFSVDIQVLKGTRLIYLHA